MSRNSFLQNGFTTFFSKKNYNKDEVVTSTLTLNLIITLFLSLLLLIFSTTIGEVFNSDILKIMIIIYCFFAPVMIINSHAVYYFTTILEFKKVFIISIVRYGLFFCSVSIIYFFIDGVSLTQLVLVNLLSILISAITSTYFLKTKSFSYKWKFNINVFKKMFHFGKYTYGVGVSSIMTRSIDQFMIGIFLNNESVAVYNLARRFLNLLEVPITAVSNLALPRLAQAANEDNHRIKVGQVFEKTSGFGMAIILPIVLALMLFPGLFIQIVAGDGYLDAIPVLQVLVFYNLFKPLSTQSGGVLEVSGKPQIGFALLIVNIIINISLNYYLIRSGEIYGGILGASIASFISGIVYMILLLRYIGKEVEFSLLSVARNTIMAYKLLFKFTSQWIK